MRIVTTRRYLGTLAVLICLLTLTACSRVDRQQAAASNAGPAGELRLGYFPNVTHAAALIGLDKGFFARELGDTKLTPTKFNDGPTEVGALLGGSVDAGFIGSGPAITAFTKSGGGAVRLIAGATSGGVQLVVKPDVTSAADLKDKTVVTPQLGNTQDVALKKWLAQNRLTGEVKITNMESAQTFSAFTNNDVQAAWLPEPWSSRLVLEASAKALVDESSLWPQGRFPTTVLVVRTEFLQQHPDTVKALLRGELNAIGWAAGNKAAAESAVNHQLEVLTRQKLSQPVIDRSFAGIRLTVDPIAGDFPQLAQDQVIAGITKAVPSLAGFVDLSPLNEVLAAERKPAMDAAGLDQK